MALEPGARLGDYEILSSLGAGGMGEVYRARDTKLGREVAIKLLLEEVSADPERLARFEREARVLASLNHPNIATLYGFFTATPAPGPSRARSPAGAQAPPESEQEGRTSFLVMELVEGETLADRIARGPLPPAEAIPLFIEIAEGLAAAHDKGIIHRDLKPANIKLGNGRVKILDFGLAKALAPEADGSSEGSASMSPTLTLAATQRGEILGTAAYMAPEQAKGRRVDRRTDIWAFGVCLFEALAGKRVFRGEDASELLASVLMMEPEWDQLPETTPRLVRRLLRRCLEKQPGKRLHDIADARLELEDALREPADPSPDPGSGTTAAPRTPILLWTLAALALGSLVAGSAAWRLKPEASRPVVRSVLSASPSAPVAVHPFVSDLAVDPNGRFVVYKSPQGLYLRPVADLEGRLLPGTRDATAAFFVSPDGAWVGFSAAGELRKVSVRGGPPVTICALPGLLNGAAWGGDGRIVLAIVDRGLFEVPAAGGEPRLISEGDRQGGEPSLAFPELLPGRRAALVTVGARSGTAELAVVDLETGERKTLVTGGGLARYLPTGHLVYGVEGTLRAVVFDPEALEVRSDPVPVLEGVLTKTTHAANFAVSSNGSLVYISGGGGQGARARLVWVDRRGREVLVEVSAGSYQYPRISPANESLVAVSDLAQDQDVWILDLARDTRTRLTFGPSLDVYSLWSSDGRQVIFSSQNEGPNDLYRKAADGTGAVERLTESADRLYPSSLSPDGRFLIYRSGTTAGFDLWLLDLEGDGEARPLLATEFEEANAEISPDGRFLAYQSNESGDWEIYVRPFPEIDGGRWQVSSGGGREPLWSRDGNELFYRNGERVMRVPVQTEPAFRAASPEELFAGPYGTQIGRMYDVSSDGERFLMVKPGAGDSGEDTLPQVVLVQNWFDELRRLVPAD